MVAGDSSSFWGAPSVLMNHGAGYPGLRGLRPGLWLVRSVAEEGSGARLNGVAFISLCGLVVVTVGLTSEALARGSGSQRKFGVEVGACRVGRAVCQVFMAHLQCS